jgi:hypothetical protein
MNKLSSYRTTIAGDENGTHVTYVSTRVVSWSARTVTLRNGGWDTVTTRRKMNQASNQFNLDFCVYRDKGETYVRQPGMTWEDCKRSLVPFMDGMSFARILGFNHEAEPAVD